jgi:hypothetical protein
MHNNQNNHVDGKYEVEERKRKVGSMLSQSMTETEIASGMVHKSLYFFFSSCSSDNNNNICH